MSETVENGQDGTDVVVIGGGPAGSTLAAFLGMKGHRVTVFEKERFPREHVGESLLPFCYPIFEQLGVLDEMKARFVRKPGVRFVDPDGMRSSVWCFGHVIEGPSALSFHVLRGEFDELLLDNASAHGATVYEETRVTGVELGDGGDVLIEVDGPVAARTHRARFVVDASGRDTFLASRLRLKSPHEDLDRAAISTHWAGADYLGGIDEGLLQIVYLGGDDKAGWIWAIPVGTDRVSSGVVLDHSYLRAEKQRLVADGSSDWMRDLYVQELSSSPFIAEMLANARMVMPLMFNGDYSYSVGQKFGPNWALVGDASAFIDPIFATGVHLSMKSAVLLSDAIDVALTQGPSAGQAALTTTYSTIEGAYRLVDRLIGIFYDPRAVSWAELGSAPVHQLHEQAFALIHYLLGGDFFERHDQYHRFVDTLTDPKRLRRFRSFVMNEEQDRIARTCALDRDLVFSPLMAPHEERRLVELQRFASLLPEHRS